MLMLPSCHIELTDNPHDVMDFVPNERKKIFIFGFLHVKNKKTKDILQIIVLVIELTKLIKTLR